MSRAPSPWQLHRALALLFEARRQLTEIDPTIADDVQLLVDSLEGMTDGVEVIDRLADAAITADLLAQATKEHAAKVVARAARAERQSKWLREQIMHAMATLEITKLQRPGYSASITPGPAHVVITDDTVLTDKYVRIKREPNKSAIGEALKAGEHVEGAALSNPAPTLRIRV